MGKRKIFPYKFRGYGYTWEEALSEFISNINKSNLRYVEMDKYYVVTILNSQNKLRYYSVHKRTIMLPCKYHLKIIESIIYVN